MNRFPKGTVHTRPTDVFRKDVLQRQRTHRHAWVTLHYLKRSLKWPTGIQPLHFFFSQWREAVDQARWGMRLKAFRMSKSLSSAVTRLGFPTSYFPPAKPVLASLCSLQVLQPKLTWSSVRKRSSHSNSALKLSEACSSVVRSAIANRQTAKSKWLQAKGQTGRKDRPWITSWTGFAQKTRVSLKACCTGAIFETHPNTMHGYVPGERAQPLQY